MKNYWFDLCYSAINGVCLMYLENFAAHEINFKSQRFHIFRLIIAQFQNCRIFGPRYFKPKLPPIGAGGSGSLFASSLSSKLGISLPQILIWPPPVVLPPAGPGASAYARALDIVRTFT